MNQKEINELKKNFTEDCGFMTINKITSVYVNPANDPESVIYQVTEIPGTINQDRFDYTMVFLRSILKGKIGKGNKEYKIMDESTKTLFETIVDSKFNSEEELNIFINHIINNYDMVSPYAIFISHATYSVLNTSKNDILENTDEFSGDSNDYDFIIVSICPIEIANDGLIYNDSEFIKEVTGRKMVQSPISGFVYPTFSNREADISSVLVYDKSAKKPNRSMVDVCGAEFTIEMPKQKELFDEMLTSVIGKDLDYALLTDINDAFIEKLEEQSIDTEPATLNKNDIIKTLIEAGAGTEYADHLNKKFDNTFGDVNIDTSAIINTTNVVKTNGFTIKYSNNVANQLSIKEINGKKYVAILVDDVVEVNDIPITK